MLLFSWLPWCFGVCILKVSSLPCRTLLLALEALSHDKDWASSASPVLHCDGHSFFPCSCTFKLIKCNKSRHLPPLSVVLISWEGGKSFCVWLTQMSLKQILQSRATYNRVSGSTSEVKMVKSSCQPPYSPLHPRQSRPVWSGWELAENNFSLWTPYHIFNFF